jgi:hypothetical protein
MILTQVSPTWYWPKYLLHDTDPSISYKILTRVSPCYKVLKLNFVPSFMRGTFSIYSFIIAGEECSPVCSSGTVLCALDRIEVLWLTNIQCCQFHYDAPKEPFPQNITRCRSWHGNAASEKMSSLHHTSNTIWTPCVIASPRTRGTGWCPNGCLKSEAKYLRGARFLVYVDVRSRRLAVASITL